MNLQRFILQIKKKVESTAIMQENLSIIIKTFNRPNALIKLLESINRFYPNIKILIADDGNDCISPDYQSYAQYFKLPYDVGLSYGRNFLIDKVDTEYLLLLDDDFEFTEKTDINKLYQAIKKNKDLDIIGGLVNNFGNEPIYYNNKLVLKDGTLYHYRKQNNGYINNIPLFDIILNFFIARTQSIRKIRWDDDLKVIEHEDFFLRCKGFLKIGYLEEVQINHNPAKSDEKKRMEYTKIFWSKHNITREIQVEGDEEWDHIHWADYRDVPVHKKKF